MIRSVWLMVLVLVAASPVQARDTLSIGLNDRGSYPYILGEGRALAEPPGLAVDLMREVGRRLGIDLRFVRLPGQRVLAELDAGRVDAALLFSFSPGRESLGAYPMRDGELDVGSRLATLAYVVYRRSGSTLNWTGDRFENLNGPIGANLNYSIVEDLRRMKVDVVEAPSTADNFRMLLAGRIAAVADHAVVADAHIAATGLTGIEKAPTPLREKPYFLILGRSYVAEYPGRAAAIWDMIAALRDQTFARLMPVYLARP